MDKQNDLVVFNSADRSGLVRFLARNLREIFTKYRYAIYNFIGSSLSARYRRSVVGFLWSLLNPLFTMIILSVVFSTIYKLPFSDFGIYIFSGLLPWNLISNSVLQGCTSIVRAEGYLKKVYIPKLVFPLVAVGVEIVNFLLSLLGLFLMALFLGARASWGLAFLPLALLLTALFITGIVLVTSILTVYFRDLAHILQIGFTGLFYLTPIIYKKEFFTGDLLAVIKFNPFYYFVDLFHSILYRAEIPEASLWLTCVCLTAVSLLAGAWVFSYKEGEVIYRL